MSAVNIEKIPEEIRGLADAGLRSALKKGTLGKVPVNFIQIENYLSGGKTGAAVFVARYGVFTGKDKSEGSMDSAFIRVLKIAQQDICESENEGYVRTRETLLDIFSQVEYYSEDEFVFSFDALSSEVKYGILLYQDVGTVAASDLKGAAGYLQKKLFERPDSSEYAERFSRELSLLLQKEVFLGLKKGLYGTVRRKEGPLNEYYGKKLKSEKVREGISFLRSFDPSVPEYESVLDIFSIHSTYCEVNYIHGDLHSENVLVWENERGFLSCKLIDFGEVIPKKKDSFTPLFWDFSRLLGDIIMNFLEEIIKKNHPAGTDEKMLIREAAETADRFWLILESFFSGESRMNVPARSNMEFIAKIHISTLFDFINEAKSGLKDLRRAEVLQDYFYCQMLFFFFFAKFPRENLLKRMIGMKLAVKIHDYIRKNSRMDSLISALEKFYFTFSGALHGSREIMNGPAPGARSPFMGLSFFQEKDKEFFFGREKFAEELLRAVETKPITALAGASGSGKSSVVYAGLIPLLREKGYMIYKFRPGTSPLQSAVRAMERRSAPRNASVDLRDLVSSILKGSPEKKIFLLGDQFEEMYTLAKDEEECRELGAAVLDLASEFTDRFRFFLTIRADFWGKLLEDSNFASVVGDSGSRSSIGQRFFLSPMNTEELRSAIEKPLEKAGLKIQEGLTDLILTSVSNQPGSLPLLEFCLEELWKRQTDYTLHYNAYKEIGEVRGALTAYADQVYESLNESEKEQLKKIMLQLIVPGPGGENTRRIALVEEIVSSVAKDHDLIHNHIDFIYHLADKRLITTGTNEEGLQTVEVVHEALIREWGKLDDWISADREFRIWQEKNRYSVKEWETGQREDGLLLHGGKIAIAEEWLSRRKSDMSEREILFIEKSLEQRERKRRKLEEEQENLRKINSELIDKIEEANANKLRAEAILLEIRYKEKKDYMQSYYETLKAGFEGKDLSEKYSQTRLTILSTLYSFAYNLQSPETYRSEKDELSVFVHEHGLFSDHMSAVTSVAISPDGKIIASASSDGWIKIWDPGFEKNIQSLDAHQSPIRSITFSPDGNMLASASSDSRIILWEFSSDRTLKEIRTFTGHRNSVNSIVFSPDGNMLASASADNTVKIWIINSNDSKEYLTLSGHQNSVNCAAFSPDGKIIASASADKTVRLWDINSEEDHEIKVLTGHVNSVNSLAFSPDGLRIASGSKDRTVRLWGISSDSRNAVKIFTGHQNAVNSVVFSPDGRMILSSSKDQTVKIWQTESDSDTKEIRTLAGHIDSVSAAVFNPERTMIITASEDRTVRLWGVYGGPDSKEMRTLAGHGNSVSSVSFSPDCRLVISGSWDKTVKLWNLSGEEIQTFEGHRIFVNSVCFSPDGKSAATAGDNIIKIWDVQSGKEIMTVSGRVNSVNSVCFSPDGKMILSAGDNFIRLWNAFTGEEIRTFSGHSDTVMHAAFHPDGRFIAGASRDKTVRIWDINSEKEIIVLAGHSDSVLGAVFSPDGKTILSSSEDKTVKIWNAFTGREIRTLTGHSDSVKSSAFSPDGKIIASGSSDRTVRLWDAVSGKEIRILTGHCHGINSIAFDSAGNRLASASWDNTVKIWDMRIEALLPLACTDLLPQIRCWLSIDHPPYPKQDLEIIYDECEKIIKSHSLSNNKYPDFQ